MKPSFTKEYQAEWLRIEELLIVAMLYHSNSIGEAKKYISDQK